MDVGIDADLGRKPPRRLAAPEAEAAGDQGVDPLETISAAAFGSKAIDEHRLALGRQLELERFGLGRELIGHVVSDRKESRQARLIFEDQLDLTGLIEGAD